MCFSHFESWNSEWKEFCQLEGFWSKPGGGVCSRTADLGLLIGGPFAVLSNSCNRNVTSLSQLPPSKSTPARPSVTLCTIPEKLWYGLFDEFTITVIPGIKRGRGGALGLAVGLETLSFNLASSLEICEGFSGGGFDSKNFRRPFSPPGNPPVRPPRSLSKVPGSPDADSIFPDTEPFFFLSKGRFFLASSRIFTALSLLRPSSPPFSPLPPSTCHRSNPSALHDKRIALGAQEKELVESIKLLPRKEESSEDTLGDATTSGSALQAAIAAAISHSAKSPPPFWDSTVELIIELSYKYHP